MGLDISVIRTGKNIDLGQLYAIRNAVADGMDWYLGDDKSQRHGNYLRLKDKAFLLSRENVLSDADVSDSTRKFLSTIGEGQFAIYLSWVVDSISDFVDENNTHLEFDFDLLPGTAVVESCSWILKDIFGRCAKETTYPGGDFIVELDIGKVSEENARWRKNGWKMKLAKMVEWFSPESGCRIADDCCGDLGISNHWVEPKDLLYYRREIEKTVGFVNENHDRLWLVSSY